ncbi:MAG: prepilin-type N-terminal cleavage/methylation domain-containing protein [bacterium]|nr:prepilin-type N-terminal cleavage/methylation domain-containing protein [bacterium]
MGSKMEQKGFTLIEMMIAMFIFAIIIVGIYTVFIQANKAFQSGRKQVLESQNARIAIEVLAREIRQATAFSAGFDSLTVRDTGGNYISYYLDGPVENQKLHREVKDASGVFVKDEIKARYIKSLTFDYFGNDYALDTNGDGVISASEIAVLGGSSTAIDTQTERGKVTLINIIVEVDTDRYDYNSDGVIDFDGPKNTIVETSVQLRNLKLF